MLHAHRTPHVARTPQAVYEFWYKDLCDVYLEAIKPVMQLDSSVAGSDNAKRKHATQTVCRTAASTALALPLVLSLSLALSLAL
jgi:valyl-tRNA synthetase